MFVPVVDGPSSRLLVCEGSCNPDIRDYDAARARIPAPDTLSRRDFRMMSQTVIEWGRRLRHTTHVPETETPIFRNGEWCRAWVCAECGHRRYT